MLNSSNNSSSSSNNNINNSSNNNIKLPWLLLLPLLHADLLHPCQRMLKSLTRCCNPCNSSNNSNNSSNNNSSNSSNNVCLILSLCRIPPLLGLLLP